MLVIQLLFSIFNVNFIFILWTTIVAYIDMFCIHDVNNNTLVIYPRLL